GVHREDRLSHPGRTDAVNPVLVNRYDKTCHTGANHYDLPSIGNRRIQLAHGISVSSPMTKLPVNRLVRGNIVTATGETFQTTFTLFERPLKTTVRACYKSIATSLSNAVS
ncbi:hypothetical protein ACV1DR_20610, partial [Aeromonas jandaei]